MTGCLGLEDIDITILSKHAPGSNHFTWTLDGDVIAHRISLEVSKILKFFDLLGTVHTLHRQ